MIASLKFSVAVLFVWILAAMNLLAGGRDHTRLAMAMAVVVDEEAPLFKDDVDEFGLKTKRRTAATVVAIAFRESGFKADALGDGGTSFCAMQVSNGAGGSSALLTNPIECVRAAFRVLRWSARGCPSFPIALYAAGTRGCEDARAQRISRDRMRIAANLLRDVGDPVWFEHVADSGGTP